MVSIEKTGRCYHHREQTGGEKWETGLGDEHSSTVKPGI